MYEVMTELVLPGALIVLMFGLGLSVSILDLRELVRCPRPLLLGVACHTVCLPIIAFLLALLLNLPAPIAISLIVITACPCGLTSNVLAFIGHADVALSISMTAVSSLISIFTTPLVVMLALNTFHTGTDPQQLHFGFSLASEKLFLFAVVPALAGLIARLLHPPFTRFVLLWLRPVAFGVALTTVVYVALIDRQLLVDNVLTIAPLALLLNIIALTLGLWTGRRFHLGQRQRMTLAIGIGMHNATMATFISVTVLGRIDYAAAPTIYGIVMVLTGLALIHFAGPKLIPAR